nr:hypothetical protein JVH1_1234 [Rhodococcus sp. JVH1]
MPVIKGGLATFQVERGVVDGHHIPVAPSGQEVCNTAEPGNLPPTLRVVRLGTAVPSR